MILSQRLLNYFLWLTMETNSILLNCFASFNASKYIKAIIKPLVCASSSFWTIHGMFQLQSSFCLPPSMQFVVYIPRLHLIFIQWFEQKLHYTIQTKVHQNRKTIPWRKGVGGGKVEYYSELKANGSKSLIGLKTAYLDPNLTHRENEGRITVSLRQHIMAKPLYFWHFHE